MNIELITSIEQQNNRSTIHLHFNSEMLSWVAFGHSAYSLRLIVKQTHINSFHGFSTTAKMPYTVVNKEALNKLRATHKIENGDNDEYYIIHLNEEFDPNDYTRWMNKLEEELAANGGFDTQTHVSHLVPKDQFIKDGMSSFARNSKRLFDMFSSFVALLVFSPLFLICTILVRREDGGPAIYKQERIGRFGRPFYIYKFRTMRLDAEAMG